MNVIKKFYAVLLAISLLSLSMLSGSAIETIIENQKNSIEYYTPEEVEKMLVTETTEETTENATKETEESTAENIPATVDITKEVSESFETISNT